MSMDSVQRRYENDINFHAMVDAMEAAIEQLQLTPSEMREAAMYAATRHEQRRRHEQRHPSVYRVQMKERKP